NSERRSRQGHRRLRKGTPRRHRQFPLVLSTLRTPGAPGLIFYLGLGVSGWWPQKQKPEHFCPGSWKMLLGLKPEVEFFQIVHPKLVIPTGGAASCAGPEWRNPSSTSNF